MLRTKGKLADSQSIITKADLLKPKYQGINGTMILPYSEETLAAQKMQVIYMCKITQG